MRSPTLASKELLVHAVSPLSESEHRRLVDLLAVALERYFKSRTKLTLTSPPTLCLYDGHGDGEAVDG